MTSFLNTYSREDLKIEKSIITPSYMSSATYLNINTIFLLTSWSMTLWSIILELFLLNFY